MTAGEAAQLLTAVAVFGNFLMSWRNGRKLNRQDKKIQAVSESTNGLSERAEQLAQALGQSQGEEMGRVQGRDQERANPTVRPILPPHSWPHDKPPPEWPPR